MTNDEIVASYEAGELLNEYQFAQRIGVKRQSLEQYRKKYKRTSKNYVYFYEPKLIAGKHFIEFVGNVFYKIENADLVKKAIKSPPVLIEKFSKTEYEKKLS